jgi:hypothetical protein
VTSPLGFTVTVLLILAFRLAGFIERGPWGVDEVSFHLTAIRFVSEEGLIPLYYQSGNAFMVGTLLRVLPVAATYGNALLVTHLIGFAIIPLAYYFVRRWVGDGVAWIAAVLLAFNGALLFWGYWLYGILPSIMFTFLAACLFAELARRDAVALRDTPRFLIIGLLFGWAFTTHESALVTACALVGTMSLYTVYWLYARTIRFKTAVLAYVLFLSGTYASAVLFFNNIVPLYYRLTTGKDYRELVVQRTLDFALSQGKHTYLGSLEYLFKIGAEFSGGWRARGLWQGLELVALAVGWPALALVALGLYRALRGAQARVLLVFALITLIYLFMGVPISSYIGLRVIGPVVPFVMLFSALGMQQLIDVAGSLPVARRLAGAGIMAFALLVIAPGSWTVLKGKPGYQRIYQFAARADVKLSRILSADHVMSYWYLGTTIPNVADLSLEKIHRNYDFVTFEPCNGNSMSMYFTLLEKKIQDVKPIESLPNPFCSQDYYAAESSHEFYKMDKRLPRGIEKDRIYIYDTKTLR